MSEWKEPTNAAEELLCSVPSLLTDHPWVREAIVQLRAHAAALERIAELEAENARLKECGHTLCGLLQEIASSFDRYARLDGNEPAYSERVNGVISKFRAEFKEAK